MELGHREETSVNRNETVCRSLSMPLEQWERVLHDAGLAEAILDRILERGRIVTVEGPSMRTRHLDRVPSILRKESSA